MILPVRNFVSSTLLLRCFDPALPSLYHMSVLVLLGQGALALFYSVGTAGTRTQVLTYYRSPLCPEWSAHPKCIWIRPLPPLRSSISTGFCPVPSQVVEGTRTTWMSLLVRVAIANKGSPPFVRLVVFQ